MYLKALLLCSIIYGSNSLSCERILRELADDQRLLVSCITRNSVPVAMCVSCKEEHTDMLHIYDLLYTNCSSIYFDKDRINLIASVQSALTGLWSKAYCDDCFNNNNWNVFNEKNNSFYKCLDGYTEDPCTNCKEQYLDLNNFFINLDQHNNGEVCYDLQDSMNLTRKKWSAELNCCHREQNLTLFTVVLGITFLLLLMFYGTAFGITKRQEHYNRVLFDEDPYNSILPHSSRRSNLNDVNNPDIDNIPSSSNAETNSSAASTSLKTEDKNGFYSNNDIESSDDDLEINTKIKSKETIKIKNV